MKKAVLRLVTKTYADYLEAAFPPSGKPCVRNFQANALLLIDALPEGSGPDLPTQGSLDAAHISVALEWLFQSLVKANPNEPWAQLAVHSLRLQALDVIPGLPKAIAWPTTLDHEGAGKGVGS